jgi:hypothetical protein
VARFYEQALAFQQLLTSAAPDAEQQKDLDFLLNVGHLFSLIVYGQLILEQAALTGLDDDIVDAIFDFQIRDFSTYAVALHGQPSSTQAQHDVELEVQPHRLGHRLPPGNPLSASVIGDGDVAQRYGLALAHRCAGDSAVALREAVPDAQ